MKELVSVIMPVYNCEKNVKKSIQSVLDQDYDNIELIIVDDGSEDMSYEVCKSIKNDKLRVFTKKNGGPSSARNFGISKATGKYIMFIDSDDMYNEHAIKSMISTIEKNKCEIVVGNYKANGNVMCSNNNDINFDNKSDAIDFLLKNKLFNTNWNKLYLKEIIDKNDIKFDEKYHMGEDIRFNLAYFECIDKICYAKDIIYLYEMTENGLTLKNAGDKCRREVELLNILYNYFKKNNHHMKFISRKIAKSFFYIDDVDFCLNSNEYLALLKEASNYDFFAKRLAKMIAKRKEKKLNFILNTINKLKG